MTAHQDVAGVVGKPEFVDWLRALAAKGGKGVVNNIDARSLGRIADNLESLSKALSEAEKRVSQCVELLEHQAIQIKDGRIIYDAAHRRLAEATAALDYLNRTFSNIAINPEASDSDYIHAQIYIGAFRSARRFLNAGKE